MYKTSLKINEDRLSKMVTEITKEILFETLPKHDACGNVYSSILEGKPYLIKEGLITSYPMENVVFAIKSLFDLYDKNDELEKNKILYFLDKGQYYNGFHGLIFLNKYSQNGTERIEIKTNINDFNQNDFDKYFIKYGWFCAINQKMDAYDNIQRLIYEKKFDVDVTEEVLNNQFLYHICSNIYLNKINKSGLKPKFSSWNVFENPERIYFFLKDMKHEEFCMWADNFSKQKNINYGSHNGWSLLRIDTQNLTNRPTFYLDPRMKDAVYTMDTISPDNIEIIDFIK